MADKGNPAQAVSVELVQGAGANAGAGKIGSGENTEFRLALSGELDFNSVSSALEKIEQQIGSHAQQHAGQPLVVDLANVARCNSAALALLVECKAIARRHSSALQYANVPAGVVQLADVCEATALLQ